MEDKSKFSMEEPFSSLETEYTLTNDDNYE